MFASKWSDINQSKESPEESGTVYEKEEIWKEHQIRDGIKLVVQNIPYLEKDIQFSADSQDSYVEFMYCLSGNIRTTLIDSFQKKHLIETAAAKYTIAYLPQIKSLSTIMAGSRIQSVGLQIKTDVLLQLTDGKGQHLCPQLYERIATSDSVPFSIDEPLPLHIRITVRQILESMLTGSMKTIFLEYKTLELLYTQLSLLDHALLESRKISQYEHQAALRAYEILMQDIASPPPLLELAKKSGITHTRLNKIFKTIYGKTVFGLLRQKRLECSRKMLEDGRRSIAEIAYECGFSNPSHLSRTFVEYYGLQPKRYKEEFTKQHENNSVSI
ncbi:helix-turn-helix domain-containing protein [Maridesulfovibrio bastinii]|uniref:helix-turn-helix domain-containing protein n=1 Tax=Maridesulfovibrio bastinii TaxID=47157 RepID=UPI0004099640|nr:AraC family transcriptional regulator [Maridesulfovibrio bastinii]